MSDFLQYLTECAVTHAHPDGSTVDFKLHRDEDSIWIKKGGGSEQWITVPFEVWEAITNAGQALVQAHEANKRPGDTGNG